MSTAYERYVSYDVIPGIEQLEDDPTAARALLEHIGYDCSDKDDETLSNLFIMFETFAQIHDLKTYAHNTVY